MTPSDELQNLLKLKDDSRLLLSTREGSRIEFKETFNFSNLSVYAKTMAGQANNSGGFIIFGIKDSPREIVGLTNNRFDEIDPVKITRFLNANFNPEINWDIDIINFYGRRLGFIFTHEASKKPIICTSNSGSDLHESRIYYRYRGLTGDIKYPELRQIFDDLIENERNSWFRNLEKIAKVGPENVLVLDIINKEMIGPKNKSYIIDESLINRINFIKAGSFNENDGEPTLKLVGDVIKADSIEVARSIPVSIDYDTLIITFLSQQSLSRDEAKAFLKESFNQASVYIPMFYFMKMAEIGVDEVSLIIEEIRHLSKHHIEDILKRLQKNNLLNDVQSANNDDVIIPDDENKINEYVSSLPTIKMIRKAIKEILKNHPGFLVLNLEYFEDSIVLNAISELENSTIVNSKDELYKILLDLYMNEYRSFTSIAKTNFRKAIARIDDALYSE